MFETLRKMIFPIIIVVLLFFVAMIILEWGLNYAGRSRYQTISYAAKINGEKIPYEIYQRVYNNLYQQESQQSNGEVSDERSRQLEEDAWNQLLQDRLLMQEAAKHNIVVTDEDVFFYLRTNPPEYIRTAPSFQTNGQFDYQKYVQAMVDQQNAPMWNQIEASVRPELVKMKMQQLVIEGVTVTDPEVQQAILDQLDTVHVSMINANWSKYYPTVTPPTDDDMKAYFEKNKENYKEDERSVFNIVFVQKAATDVDNEAARQEALSVADSAKSGVDFAALAQNHSDDETSAQQGGEVGWITKGQTVAEFDAKAFAMKEGEISEPVKSSFGWHIIKNEGFRDTTVTPPGKSPEKMQQTRVAHILIRIAPSQATLDGIYQKLQELQTEAAKTSFDAAAKELGLTVQRTEPFGAKAPIQTLGNLPAAHDFAAQAKVGEVSSIFDISSGYALAQLAERIPAGVPTFDEVKARVKNDVLRERVAKLCRESVERVYTALKSGMSPDQAAKTQGLTYDTVPPFSRSGYIPGIGRPAKAMGAAFSLKNIGDFTPPMDHDVGTAIFVLRGRTSPDLTQFNEKRDSVLNAVLYQKQQAVYGRWFENLIKNSQIENNIDAINRGTAQMAQ